jgi:hypothetical protein
MGTMAAFVVIASSDNDKIAGAMLRVFPQNFQIEKGQYLVSDRGATAEKIAERIGTSGDAGKFVVFSIAGSSGYHRKDMWEWLKLNE